MQLARRGGDRGPYHLGVVVKEADINFSAEKVVWRLQGDETDRADTQWPF